MDNTRQLQTCETCKVKTRLIEIVIPEPTLDQPCPLERCISSCPKCGARHHSYGPPTFKIGRYLGVEGS